MSTAKRNFMCVCSENIKVYGVLDADGAAQVIRRRVRMVHPSIRGVERLWLVRRRKNG